MKPLCLTIDVPPSANHLYPTNKAGKRFQSAEATAFKDKVGWLLRAAMVEQGWEAPAGASLALQFTLHFRDSKRRHDLSNAIKAAEDAICAVLGIDDSRVVDLHARRGRDDPQHPRCEVQIEVVQ
jgi:Holliday junction resolvase RusA-like endonuclease